MKGRTLAIFKIEGKMPVWKDALITWARGNTIKSDTSTSMFNGILAGPDPFFGNDLITSKSSSRSISAMTKLNWIRFFKNVSVKTFLLF